MRPDRQPATVPPMEGGRLICAQIRRADWADVVRIFRMRTVGYDRWSFEGRAYAAAPRKDGYYDVWAA